MNKSIDNIIHFSELLFDLAPINFNYFFLWEPLKSVPKPCPLNSDDLNNLSFLLCFQMVLAESSVLSAV